MPGLRWCDLDRSAFEVDAALDSNAVRYLAGLDVKEWGALRIAVRELGLSFAWIPWVIQEVVGTNLVRRNLTDADVCELVHAVRRYDSLCERRILSNAPKLMWDAFHEIAGVEAPAPGPPDGQAEHRRWIDRFLCVSRADQIRIEETPERAVVVTLHDDDRPWGLPLQTGFVSSAEKGVERLKELLAGRPTMTRMDLAVAYFNDWLPTIVASSLKVGDEAVRAFRETWDPDRTIRTSFCGGLIEGWYVAGRALGLAKSITENDGRDIAIGSYMSTVAVLVTDDGGFRETMKGLLFDRRRVIGAGELIDDVGASAARTGA